LEEFKNQLDLHFKSLGDSFSHKKLCFYYDLVCMQRFLVQCVTLKSAVLNLACIFSLKDSSSTCLPSAVDSSLSLSHGACAASEEPFSAEEEEGTIKQDNFQGRNQEQTKL